MSTQHQPSSTANSLTITRVIHAPRALVFKAWSSPENLVRWYAPTGCSILFKELDFRPGGKFHSCIKTPSGYECWCTGEYREIMEPERIVFTMRMANEAGEPIDPAAMGMDPEWPAETVVSVTLTEHEGHTTLTLHQTVGEAIAKRTGAYPSWLEMLDNLEQFLSS